jgi:hypothetical protein
MSYALNRVLPNRGPGGAVALAGQVLDSVLDDCGVGLDAMRCGARVTILRDDRFDAAVRLYRDGRWELAFESLAKLADQNHGPAARLALLMLRYGAPLYGASFPARPVQIARWAQRVLLATSRATASPSSITARA